MTASGPSGPLVFLGSIFCKQYGPRSDWYSGPIVMKNSKRVVFWSNCNDHSRLVVFWSNCNEEQ